MHNAGCKITNFILSLQGLMLKKTCDNCAECPVMKIDEKLRFAYDFSFNWPMFEGCGKDFNGQEGILCFARQFAKTVNWKALEEAYKKNKEIFDKNFEVSKKRKDK